MNPLNSVLIVDDEPAARDIIGDGFRRLVSTRAPRRPPTKRSRRSRLDYSPATMKLPAGNVLIVEDDRDTRQMFETLFATERFHAVAAEDGLEALHLLRTVRHRAPDVPLPRVAGPDDAAVRRPRASGGPSSGDPTVSSVPVAVMSGALDVAERAEALDAAATVTKPSDFDALLAVVRRHCA